MNTALDITIVSLRHRQSTISYSVRYLQGTYTARLWDIPSGYDWGKACKYMPNTIHNQTWLGRRPRILEPSLHIPITYHQDHLVHLHCLLPCRTHPLRTVRHPARQSSVFQVRRGIRGVFPDRRLTSPTAQFRGQQLHLRGIQLWAARDPDDLYRRGIQTPHSMILLHDKLACSGVASSRTSSSNAKVVNGMYTGVFCV